MSNPLVAIVPVFEAAGIAVCLRGHGRRIMVAVEGSRPVNQEAVLVSIAEGLRRACLRRASTVVSSDVRDRFLRKALDYEKSDLGWIWSSDQHEDDDLPTCVADALREASDAPNACQAARRFEHSLGNRSSGGLSFGDDELVEIMRGVLGTILEAASDPAVLVAEASLRDAELRRKWGKRFPPNLQ